MSKKNFNILKLTLNPFKKKFVNIIVYLTHILILETYYGAVQPIKISKKENLRKGCVRNVALKHFKAHTEPLILKSLSILKFPDKNFFSFKLGNFKKHMQNFVIKNNCGFCIANLNFFLLDVHF